MPFLGIGKKKLDTKKYSRPVKSGFALGEWATSDIAIKIWIILGAFGVLYVIHLVGDVPLMDFFTFKGFRSLFEK